MKKQDKYKILSRGISRDMSSEAISRRLDILAELYETAVMLGKIKKNCEDPKNKKFKR